MEQLFAYKLTGQRVIFYGWVGITLLWADHKQFSRLIHTYKNYTHSIENRAFELTFNLSKTTNKAHIDVINQDTAQYVDNIKNIFLITF